MIPELPRRPAQPRPGQRPPSKKSRGNEHEDQRQEDHDNGALDPPHATSTRHPSHSQRLQREDEAWRNKLPVMRESYIAALPQAHAMKAAASDDLQQRMQGSLDQLREPSPCKCMAAGHQPDFARLPEGRDVRYIGMSCAFKLNMPQWQCSGCRFKLDADPLVVGCFPSTPVVPEVWYDLQVSRRECGYSGIRMLLCAPRLDGYPSHSCPTTCNLYPAADAPVPPAGSAGGPVSDGMAQVPVGAAGVLEPRAGCIA